MSYSNCIFSIEAMYLDPSYQGILTTDAKQQAKLHLSKTWKLLGHLDNNIIPANAENETISNVNQNLSDDDIEVTDSFESYLRSHSSTPTATTTSIPPVNSIETLLEQYDRVPYQTYK